MRRLAWLALLLCALPAPAWAKQDRCPLPLDSCIVQFGRMRERPWLGVYVQPDSLGQRVVARVVPGGPAERAGVRAGDVLESLGGVAPPVFFAGKAGWKDGDRVPVRVLRGGKPRSLALTAQHVPEEWFARVVGEHMLEAHLAYMEPGEHPDSEVR